MFTFGFSDDGTESDCETEKHNFELPEKTTPSWKECEEIPIGPNLLHSELFDEQSDYMLKIEFEDTFVIKHVSPEIVAEIICKTQNADDTIVKAEQQHSDLVPAVYEGGLKIWQCTYDILNHLYQKEINFKGQKVLDLGCGAGILGLYAYKQGAKVCFQDYNPEVLKHVTIPNVLLNNREDTDTPKDCRFFSGDWQSFIEVTAEEFDSDDKLFDCILTSETIYNCENYVKLNQVFKSRLKKSGIIYLGAKTCYFGIGGNMRCFEDMIKADDIFKIEKVWENTEGVNREIVTLKFK